MKKNVIQGKYQYKRSYSMTQNTLTVEENLLASHYQEKIVIIGSHIRAFSVYKDSRL